MYVYNCVSKTVCLCAEHIALHFASVLLPLLVGHQRRLVVCLRCVAYHRVTAWRALAVCCHLCAPTDAVLPFTD